MVCQTGNLLRSYGVGRGDKVVIYMPVSPLAVATMLACTRIGALHSVVFAGFSSEALASRIQDCKSLCSLNCCDPQLQVGKKYNLNQNKHVRLSRKVHAYFPVRRKRKNGKKTH